MTDGKKGGSNWFKENGLKAAFTGAAVGVAIFFGVTTSNEPRAKKDGRKADTENVVQKTPRKTLEAFSFDAFTKKLEAEAHRNIFYATTDDAIREYRAITGNADKKGPLTKAERQHIRAINEQGQKDAKVYKIKPRVASTLRFISDVAHIDHAVLMSSLASGSGGFSNAAVMDTSGSEAFRFTLPEWLYLVREHGRSYGLDFFAGKIAGTGADVSVGDAGLLRQIKTLSDNPRLQLLMGAEYLKHRDSLPAVTYRGFDPGMPATAHTAQVQQSLQTLGFDIGARLPDGIRDPLTNAALQEFAGISGLSFESDSAVTTALFDATREAVADAKKHTTKWIQFQPRDIFAIRHASRVVGYNYGSMMELVAIESSFKAEAEAETSSAVGLFQFIDATWRSMIYKYADKYGVGALKEEMEPIYSRWGDVIDAQIDNPFIERYVMSLRTVPYFTSLIGAESLRENRENLAASLPGHDVQRTDEYLAHFMGPVDAAAFIRTMKKNPDTAASKLFPAEASANKSIFFKAKGEPRSLDEIYQNFSRHFDTGVFDPKPKKQAAAKKTTPKKKA